MKIWLLIAILLTSINLTLPALAQGWRPGEMEVKVTLQSPDEIQSFRELRLNGDFHREGYAIVYVIQPELDRIISLGLRYEILISDMNQHYQGFWLLRDDYHSYQQIIDLMDSLATTFPTICKKVIFGYSVQGRQCAALKISDNVTMHEAEPKVLFDGSIHGDEIGGAENLVRFARELCVNYATDTNIAYLINNREIWLYCMVNPDGRVNMSRYNYNGVDVNRDFGYMWDAWGGSPAAFSQPESRANRDWSYNNEPTIFITYHSGDEICLYPWGYRYNTCPDDDHQSYLAKMYSDSSLYPNLAYGMAATDLYAVNGASDDANYGMLGTISFTVEMSNNKQPPTYQIQLYYSRNKTAMLQMLRQAGYGLCGTVTDSLTGTPIKAMVFINNFYPTYTGDSTGYFHKFVLGGTYSIKIVANGYKTKEIDSISVLANSTTTLNFQLVPQPGQYAFKIAASQIPGNNFADEGNTPAALGPPDSVSYSIGKNGWCIFDMQNPIVDGYGDDLKIYDGGTTPEGFTCFVSGSKDGPWTQLGTGIGTTSFDFANIGVAQAQFVKIVDDGDGAPNIADAGFDLDAIEAVQHSQGTYIALEGTSIADTTNGNSNARLDPGETADLIILLQNNGTTTADSLTGTFTTSDPFITINNEPVFFGTILPTNASQGSFSLTASDETPTGHLAEMTLELTANDGQYTQEITFYLTIGQIPVLVLDLDGNRNSGTVIKTTLDGLGISNLYMNEFPTNANDYQSIFVCLGTYSVNHVLTYSEGLILASYLNNGGKLYMEGGETWYYNSPTPVHTMFKIQGVADGGSDLSVIQGQTNTFTQGMSFNYGGDNYYIDRIAPIAPAFTIFKNQNPIYNCAVAYNGGSYKTIGSSFELGGLINGSSPSTKAGLIANYLEFFGIITPAQLAINLPQGWSTISTNVEPIESNMNDVFQGLTDKIKIVKNGVGQVYIPADNINTIGNWKVRDAYQIKMNSADSLIIHGLQVIPQAEQITLQAGWNLIAYFRTTPISVEQGLSSIVDNIQIVKNNLGQMYVPAYGINTIGEMQPGEGYYIYVYSPGVLVYPGN